MLTNAKQSWYSILKESQQPRFLAMCAGCIMKNLFKTISKQVLLEAASSPAVKCRDLCVCSAHGTGVVSSKLLCLFYSFNAKYCFSKEGVFFFQHMYS